MDCVGDLLSDADVRQMQTFIQHGDVTTFDHCLCVSYYSYLWAKRLGLDCKAAARGGLLHDFYLYDWHTTKPPCGGLHGFVHPALALKNAESRFKLSDREIEIIRTHMWPLTVRPPKYREAYVVLLCDKWCATLETASLKRAARRTVTANILNRIRMRRLAADKY